MLNELATAKKINLSEYDYYYAQIIKGYLHIHFCVRCGVGACTPMTMKTLKLRCFNIDQKNARGESDYMSFDYETDGHFLYIPTMK